MNFQKAFMFTGNLFLVVVGGVLGSFLTKLDLASAQFSPSAKTNHQSGLRETQINGSKGILAELSELKQQVKEIKDLLNSIFKEEEIAGVTRRTIVADAFQLTNEMLIISPYDSGANVTAQ